MTTVIAFANLPGLSPQAVFVAAGADIAIGERVLAGRLFLASRGGEVAVCAEIEDVHTGQENLSALARRRQLSAAAEIEDHNGLVIVSRLWLRTGAAASASAWAKGVARDQLQFECRDWWAAVTVASQARGRETLPLPVADRPHGDGEPIEIAIKGDIGEGKNTADRIAALMGNPARIRRTVVIDMDSLGGRCDEGLKIYRALAEWPCAVYCNVHRAQSMAAVVALAADVRTIRPGGSMLIHPPAVDGAGRLQEATLLGAAKVLAKTTHELAGIIAVRTAAPIAMAKDWLQNETTFTPGEALAWGLVHAIKAEDVPITSRPIRASFAPINGPFRNARGASR